MRTWISSVFCRARKHPLRTLTFQTPGRQVEISRCRCGERTGKIERQGQFPLRPRDQRLKAS